MGLHWNIEDVSAREGRDWAFPDDRLNGRIECLIWACMIVGMTEISERNATAFYARLAEFEAARGPLNTNGEPLTFSDVWRTRGLRTNASTMTAAAWRKKIAQIWTEHAERAASALTAETEGRP